MFTLLTTWKRGRKVLMDRLSEDALPLKEFIQSIEIAPPVRVEGTAVVSSVRRRSGRLELRAFNPSPDQTTLTVDRVGRRVDLRGRDLGAFDGELSLRPYEIVTLSLDG